MMLIRIVLATYFLMSQCMFIYLPVFSFLVGIFTMAVETVAEVDVPAVVPRQPVA